MKYFLNKSDNAVNYEKIVKSNENILSHNNNSN